MQVDYEIWKSVAFWVSSTITAGSLAGLIVQQLVNWRLQRELERYKAKIKAENDVTLEGVKATSEISIEKFKKSYGLLADRQAEAIEGIFANLTDLQLALHQCVSPFRSGDQDSDQKSLRNLSAARWAGWSHFRKKRLFLPQEVGNQVEAHYSKVSGVELRFSTTPRGQGSRADYWERVNELAEEVEGPISQTLQEIEVTFRQLFLATNNNSASGS